MLPAIAVVLGYCLLGLRPYLADDLIVQDDARQAVAFLQRYDDPALFRDDFIADYYSSVAPLGYRAFYAALGLLGINAIAAAPFVAILLTLASAWLCFRLAVEVLPSPFAAFVATVVLGQALWWTTDLLSATPRGFLYPLLLALILGWLRRSVALTAMMSVGLASFYPPAAILAAAALAVRVALSFLIGERDQRLFVLTAVSIMAVVVCLLPFAFSSSEFGRLFTAEEARALPEFQPDGRLGWFVTGIAEYYVRSGHTGLLPWPVRPPLLWLGLALPALPGLRRRLDFTSLMVASLFLFGAANLLLFHLYEPSRYVVHTFRLVGALGAAGAISSLGWVARAPLTSRAVTRAGAIAVAGVVVLAPWLPPMRHTSQETLLGYAPGTPASLYEFVQTTAKDALFASLLEEVNNLPALGQRSILVGREYAAPYHVDYYHEFRRRMSDLIGAHYSPERTVLAAFVDRYGVDYFLVDDVSFTDAFLANDAWLRNYKPQTRAAREMLRRGRPALAGAVGHCDVFTDGPVHLLDAACAAMAG